MRELLVGVLDSVQLQRVAKLCRSDFSEPVKASERVKSQSREESAQKRSWRSLDGRIAQR